MISNKKTTVKKSAQTAQYTDAETTICAPATAVGQGAIGIIRVSGPEAIRISDKVFTPFAGHGAKCAGSSLLASDSYLMRYGSVSDLDDVLAVVFRAPHSYTGENSVEFYCHASSYIMNGIIRLLIDSGAQMAEPGEFTQRAFLNGKMDLAQAEAVADLIASETRASHDVAMQQMRGGFSRELKQMRDSLLNLASLLELELDFGDEDVEFADRKKLSSLLSSITSKVSELIDSYALGNVIKNGVPVAIVGAVNTGKSTLLNALAGEEKAIVSEIQGTTRDSIEDTVNIDGTVFRFIDTAGIRSTTETIEILGIERTYQKLKEASVAILMLDAGRPGNFRSSIQSISQHLDSKRQRLIIVLNKCDLLKGGCRPSRADRTIAKTSEATSSAEAKIEEICKALKLSSVKIVCATLKESAAKHTDAAAANTCNSDHCTRQESLMELKKILSGYGKKYFSGSSDRTLVTNTRHYNALVAAKAALLKASKGLEERLSADLLAQDTGEAIYHIGTIVGEISSQDVLNNIFANFCIGK